MKLYGMTNLVLPEGMQIQIEKEEANLDMHRSLTAESEAERIKEKETDLDSLDKIKSSIEDIEATTQSLRESMEQNSEANLLFSQALMEIEQDAQTEELDLSSQSSYAQEETSQEPVQEIIQESEVIEETKEELNPDIDTTITSEELECNDSREELLDSLFKEEPVRKRKKPKKPFFQSLFKKKKKRTNKLIENNFDTPAEIYNIEETVAEENVSSPMETLYKFGVQEKGSITFLEEEETSGDKTEQVQK